MKTLKITLSFLLFTFFNYAQTVHTVDNRANSGAQFTSLQNAVNAAVTGDIIHVHPSPTSYGNITVNKQLKIIGLGHDPITHTQGLVAKLNVFYMSANSAFSEITGLDIGTITANGANSNRNNIHIIHNKIGAISVRSPNWRIEGNYITNTNFSISAISTGTGAIIKNNFMLGGVSGLDQSSIVSNNIFLSTTSAVSDTFINNCTFTSISNNIFIATNANMTTIGISNSPFVVMRKNLTYNFGGGVIADLPDLPVADPLYPSNINNTNPVFINVPLGNEGDFYNNDYHLTAAILGTDATTNIGIYGLNFTFDHQGRPDLQPYPITVTINNNIIAPGQNLSVRFTAAQKQ